MTFNNGPFYSCELSIPAFVSEREAEVDLVLIQNVFPFLIERMN